MIPRIPNFRQRRALVLHRDDFNRTALVGQLGKLGLVVDALWPVGDPRRVQGDFVFFDADLGYDGLFPWLSGEPPVPLVAMVGSEAPGRVEWALGQSPSAFMLKPVGSTGAFSALVVASHTFAERQRLTTLVKDLGLRIKARSVVVRAVLRLMQQFAIDEAEALRMLGTVAMRERTSVEALSALVLAESGAVLKRGGQRFQRTDALHKAGRPPTLHPQGGQHEPEPIRRRS